MFASHHLNIFDFTTPPCDDAQSPNGFFIVSLFYRLEMAIPPKAADQHVSYENVSDVRSFVEQTFEGAVG